MHKTTREDWPGLKRELQGDRGLGIRPGKRKEAGEKGGRVKPYQGVEGKGRGRRMEKRQEPVVTC